MEPGACWAAQEQALGPGSAWQDARVSGWLPSSALRPCGDEPLHITYTAARVGPSHTSPGKQHMDEVHEGNDAGQGRPREMRGLFSCAQKSSLKVTSSLNADGKM